MTDLDPQLTATLDRLLSVPREPGDWARVVADADSIDRRRVAPAFAVAALVAAALACVAVAPAFVRALGGDDVFWFLGPGSPKPTTRVVTATWITDRSGLWWTLTAYQSEHKGLCFQLTSLQRGAGACRAPEPLGVSVMNAEAPSGTFVFGPVTTEAARVQISGGAGQVDAKVATAPAELQMDIKFYVVELPPGLGAPREVSALDERGNVIATRTITDDS